MSNEEKRDEFEDKIDAAMSKIVADAAPDTPKQAEEEPGPQMQPDMSASRRRPAKSARPKKINYVPITEEELEPEVLPVKKKHKGLKVAGLAAAMLVIAAGTAYAGITYYYSDRFFEGTTINGIDCSRMTAYEAEQAIAGKVEDYSIEVLARNQEAQAISGDKIDYRYLSNGEVLALLKQQKPYEWVRGYFQTTANTAAENVTFDKTKLETEVKALNCAQKENQVAPENAYVAFNDSQFEIVPETEGSKLKVKQAYKALGQAISESQRTINLDDHPKVYEKAAVTSDSPQLQATKDACNNFTNASITYTFGEQTVTLDGETIKDWLQFDDKGRLINDDASFQQHIADFVAQLAADYNTVNTEREFYTTSGRTVYVYGSAYGWKIDQEAEVAQLTQDIRSGTQTQRDPIYSMTANSHGHNDFGNTYIEVDLSAQHLYYYQNGDIILDTDIVSGNMSYADRQTPPGVFTLYFKKSPDVLRGQKKPDGTYEYEQPVQYWMPFNGGIGFHDASWQPYFGGDRYLTGGSHGCINMPPWAAEQLYYSIEYNVPIICFY